MNKNYFINNSRVINDLKLFAGVQMPLSRAFHGKFVFPENVFEQLQGGQHGQRRAHPPGQN
jgi:hypothetical protein